MSTQMQSPVQFNAQMSLYIPHVFPNFTTEYIAGVFESMEFGKVDHIDLVAKLDKNGNAYNAAYIHFAYWRDGPISENFQARVKDPNRDAKLIYDDPWYWIVLENTAKKNVPGDRKVCIDLTPGLYDEVHECKEDDEDYEEGELHLATTHEKEISYLTQKLSNQNRYLLQTDEYLCESQKENLKMEAELQEAQQEIIDKELDMQNMMHILDTIIQKVLGAKTLEEAQSAICTEMWGCQMEEEF